ncbi:MAG: SelT/SelW/SelH family protein [Halobaculum sp.]
MVEVEIEYCVPCGLLDHAEETQHELLEKYGRELDGVRLTPGHGGVFAVRADGDLVWDRDDEGSIEPDQILARVGERV